MCIAKPYSLENLSLNAISIQKFFNSLRWTILLYIFFIFSETVIKNLFESSFSNDVLFSIEINSFDLLLTLTGEILF